LKSLDLVVRLEWVFVAVAALLAYAIWGGSWLLFALLVLAPDLSFLGYLGGPRVGALAYNALHTLFGPFVLLAVAMMAGHSDPALSVGLIWLLHIAIDRALGYGLKLPSGFQDTHLGRIGHDLSP
jgi:hypothetical protein